MTICYWKDFFLLTKKKVFFTLFLIFIIYFLFSILSSLYFVLCFLLFLRKKKKNFKSLKYVGSFPKKNNNIFQHFLYYKCREILFYKRIHKQCCMQKKCPIFFFYFFVFGEFYHHFMTFLRNVFPEDVQESCECIMWKYENVKMWKCHCNKENFSAR